MKLFLLLLSVSGFSTLASADVRLSDLNVSDLNFGAPVVISRTGLPGNTPIGTIIYDQSSGGFYGLAPQAFGTSTANWLQLANIVGNPVVSVGASERLERISFGGTTEGTNICSAASPGGGICSIYRQSGFASVSGVTRLGTGQYTVNVNSGTFSTVPTCVCSGYSSGVSSARICQYFAATSTTTALDIRIYDTAGAVQDGSVSLMCQGPH